MGAAKNVRAKDLGAISEWKGKDGNGRKSRVQKRYPSSSAGMGSRIRETS